MSTPSIDKLLADIESATNGGIVYRVVGIETVARSESPYTGVLGSVLPPHPKPALYINLTLLVPSK